MNAQNLPKDTVRKLFVARPGFKFWFLDYSQIELRVAAFYLRDELWIKAFKEGADLHQQTAQLVFGTKEITETQRAFGKKQNFAMTYGSGVPRIQHLLAEVFGGRKEEYRTKAEQIVGSFRRAHPNIKKMQNMARDRMWDDKKRESYFTDILSWESAPRRLADYVGYVQTVCGRRFVIPDNYIYKIIEWLTSGTATGDLFKKKYCEVSDFLERIECGGMVVALTHDELMIELPESDRENEIIKECKLIMENIPEITKLVPILVDVKYGYNWGEKFDWQPKTEN